MATRKVSEPTTKTTVRLFKSDIARARKLMPNLSISNVIRRVFRETLDKVEKNMETRKRLIADIAKEAPDA